MGSQVPQEELTLFAAVEEALLAGFGLLSGFKTPDFFRVTTGDRSSVLLLLRKIGSLSRVRPVPPYFCSRDGFALYDRISVFIQIRAQSTLLLLVTCRLAM